MDDLALTCPKCGTAKEVQTPPPPQTVPAQQMPPIPQYRPPVYQPPVYNQPTYQPVMPQSYAPDEHVSVGGWIGIFCINLIPLIGWLIYIIMLFVWAFGDTKKKTLKNFAKANLVIFAIFFVFGIAAVIFMAIAGFSLTEYFDNVSEFTYNY
jgi:hypothetical protein